MTTKREVARAYALMECERHESSPSLRKHFVDLGLVTEDEVQSLEGPTESGPHKTMFIHLFWCWTLDNPAPFGKEWGISTETCQPIL